VIDEHGQLGLKAIMGLRRIRGNVGRSRRFEGGPHVLWRESEGCAPDVSKKSIAGTCGKFVTRIEIPAGSCDMQPRV
jgi:hypothetical protein